MTFNDYLLIADTVTAETNERLMKLGRPEYVSRGLCVRFVRQIVKLFTRLKKCFKSDYLPPEDLADMPIGQYLYFSDLLERKSPEYTFAIFRELAGMDEGEVMALPVEQVVGFANFVTKQLAEISKQMDAQHIEPTAEEKAAGIDRLGGGAFALLDYLAKRNRLTIVEAERIKWPMVVAMMRADKTAEEYRRRLQKQYNKK